MDGVISKRGSISDAHPSRGIPRNVAGSGAEYAVPADSPSRILAVTGTMAKPQPRDCWLTFSNRLVLLVTLPPMALIGDHLVEPGDNTGPQAQMILQDPTVEVAVQESARAAFALWTSL